MGTAGSTTDAVTRARPCPDRAQSTSFGADTLLLTAFVISLGIPLYYVLGFSGPPVLLAVYVASAAIVPSLTPLLTWWLRWGPVPRHALAPVALTSFGFVMPVLAAAIVVVGLGFEIALVGVAVMAYIAALLIQVVAARFGGSAALPRMVAVRFVCALGTPIVVLGLTQGLPHGIDAIGGWSIPMPIAVAGAIGAARGFESALGRSERRCAPVTGDDREEGR